MLDKTIEYIRVVMFKDDIENYPRISLPEGYSFAMYEEGDFENWLDVQLSVDHVEGREFGKKYFEDEFGQNRELLKERMIFVKDGTGKFVASACLWYGEFDGCEYERLHWLAVNPNHTGKGIAKAMLTKLMELHKQLGLQHSIFLTTQTWSYMAINIYLQFGFKPYYGTGSLESNNRRAWDIIIKKINNSRNENFQC